MSARYGGTVSRAGQGLHVDAAQVRREAPPFLAQPDAFSIPRSRCCRHPTLGFCPSTSSSAGEGEGAGSTSARAIVGGAGMLVGGLNRRKSGL